MEWLADKLTCYIIKKKSIDDTKYEIYRYGMLTGLEVTLCMAICIIIAIHLKSFLEFIVLIAVLFSLRAYVGGIHLKHYLACLFCSCFIITLLLFTARYWSLSLKVAMIVTMVAFFLIYRLAPITTKEKVNDKEEGVFFDGQRKRILLGIAVLDIGFMVLRLKIYWSLIMYTMLVVLISMVLGIRKNDNG